MAKSISIYYLILSQKTICISSCVLNFRASFPLLKPYAVAGVFHFVCAARIMRTCCLVFQKGRDCRVALRASRNDRGWVAPRNDREMNSPMCNYKTGSLPIAQD